MRISTLFAAMLATTSMLAAADAVAATESFTIDWSGAPYGNHASAVGEITIDTSLIGVGTGGSIPIASVQAFSITVSGAGAGDGTFTKSDSSRWRRCPRPARVR